MADRELATTRIALLELGEERRTAREGYDLLDEKRMLLAARMLKLVGDVEARRRERDRLWAAACESLRAALDRHGLHDLETLRTPRGSFRCDASTERVLGVELVSASEHAAAAESETWPSPELGDCAAAWRALGANAVELAACECSLWRLADEYARTERRASAIEQVLLPELERGIATIEAGLEAIEQEDAVRVHRR
jgi:V/A-type H+-transporting ATPase subunit D